MENVILHLCAKPRDLAFHLPVAKDFVNNFFVT